MRASSLLWLALVFPAVVSAQTLTVRVRDQEDLVVSPNDCGSPVRVTWTLSQAVVPCSQLQFWVTTGTCDKEPVGNDLELRSYTEAEWGTQATSGEIQLQIADLPGFDTPTDGGTGGCGQPNQELEHKVCAYANFGQLANCTPLSGSELAALKPSPVPTITYDSVPPQVPTITEVVSLDSALGVELAFDRDDTASVRVELGLVSSGGFDRQEEFGPEVGTARIEGLTNGFEYQLQATAIDAAGNESGPSAIGVGTPVLTEGFWGAYKRAGGTEEGGCTAGPGVSVIPAGLVVLGLWLRRRQGQ